MKPRLALIIALISSALVVLGFASGCTPGAGAGPSTWIDRPLDGDQVAMEPLTIEAHASDVDGVARLEFFVDDTSIGAVPTDGSQFVEAKAGWSPSAPGTHMIRASGVDSQGNKGATISARVVVVGLKATEVPIPTVGIGTPPPATEIPQPVIETLAPAFPSEAPLPATVLVETLAPAFPSETPLPSPTPTTEATSVPVCPGAPGIASFTAQPATISVGQSATLQWGRVTNATGAEIDPDIGGVPTPGSVSVSPRRTTTYTLTATGCGGTTRKQVTVVVKTPPSPTVSLPTMAPAPTPDTTPPTISGLNAKPTTIYVAGCPNTAQNTTVSAHVSDASGVQSVVASWSLDGQSGQTGMSAAGGGLYQATIGGFAQGLKSLSIYVNATDAFNNSSQAGPISVKVNPCIQ